ncbi:MAG: hypothetical protein H6739_29995 [Alphaproteobacteria bacterium]|nr:hypothetical protein [Alphaproteobacteria bacterium]
MRAFWQHLEQKLGYALEGKEKFSDKVDGLVQRARELEERAATSLDLDLKTSGETFRDLLARNASSLREAR